MLQTHRCGYRRLEDPEDAVTDCVLSNAHDEVLPYGMESGDGAFRKGVYHEGG